MTIHHLHIELGTAAQLLPVFSFAPGVADKNPALLKDAIEHSINQTLLRDRFYSAWGVVMHKSRYTWDDDDVFTVKVTSPHHDVSGFQRTLGKFINAIRLGHQIYQQQQPALEAQRKKLVAQAHAANPDSDHPLTKADFACYFLPPFGLSMVATDCIQLLHYPPDSTLTYMDYLYSPTNRRWESLLGYNNYPGEKNTLVETIVDIAPIAASGGSRGGQLIQPLLEKDVFAPYAKAMLQALLRTSKDGKSTQPIVAYGGPVGAWLQKNYAEKLAAQGVAITSDDDGNLRPEVCEAFVLHFLGEDGPGTPVICANHPIKFNYYDKDLGSAQKLTGADREAAIKAADKAAGDVLSQDLICAGWQARMAQGWYTNTDPDFYKNVRKTMFAQWSDGTGTRFREMLEVFRVQVKEFALESMPRVNSKAWQRTLDRALKD
jgi:hypothetical protein